MSPDDTEREFDDYNELQCYMLAHENPDLIHQHIVDAWIAQHANEDTKPIGLTFSLVGLYLHVERGFSGPEVHRVHRTLARHKRTWPSFRLPQERGSITASTVMAEPAGKARDEAVLAWCRSVWAAFKENRQTVVELLKEYGIA